jgi:hypothetical protein
MQNTVCSEIWENRRSHRVIGGMLNTIKFGTGTAIESATDTSLNEQIYASDDTNTT